MTQNKQPDTVSSTISDTTSGPEKYIITAEVIAKKKDQEDDTALYVRRSIQDYYIKFCESDILRENLEQKISMLTGLIKTVKLEVSFRNGRLGDCENNQTSEESEYIVIHRLF